MINPNKILLVDAVRTVISSDVEYNIDTRGLNKDLADFLKSLPNRKIVVTNAPGVKLEKIKRYLSDYDFQVYSLENNPGKTDPEYFKKLLADFDLKVEDCFYFDHKQENLDAARSIGIEAEQFINNEQIIPFLSAL